MAELDGTPDDEFLEKLVRYMGELGTEPVVQAPRTSEMEKLTQAVKDARDANKKQQHAELVMALTPTLVYYRFKELRRSKAECAICKAIMFKKNIGAHAKWHFDLGNVGASGPSDLPVNFGRAADVGIFPDGSILEQPWKRLISSGHPGPG